MSDKAIDKLEIFNQLCAIRPTEWISRFPYSYITDGKIKFTEKVIELKATKETSGGKPETEIKGGLEIYLI